MQRLAKAILLVILASAWSVVGSRGPTGKDVGIFGLSGIIPDPAWLDGLGVEIATSGFWIGPSADALGGSKETMHTRQFRAFVERGIAPIATFYLGDLRPDAARWAEDIVRHYTTGTGAVDVGAPIVYWELGDEQNGTWGTSCVPEEYARRVSVLGPAIRRACPDCTIIMGGLLDGPEMGTAGAAPYLDAFLDSGGGEWIDVFAFHYYGLARPDDRLPGAQLYSSAQKIVGSFRDVLTQHGRATAPIWVTETSTFSGGMGEIEQSERDQAADLVKRYVFLWSLGVDVVQWCYLTEPRYEGTGVGFFDQSGLIYNGDGPYDRGSGVRKRSYFAYQEMVDRLRNAALVRREEDSGVTWVQFETGSGPLTVLWQDPWLREGPVWIRGAAGVEVVDLVGSPIASGYGWMRLSLSIEPVYILGSPIEISLNAPPLGRISVGQELNENEIRGSVQRQNG